jgi:hypothetical protein
MPNNNTGTQDDHLGCSHDHDAPSSPVGSFRIQEPRGFPDRSFRDRTDLLFGSTPRRTSPTDPRECPYRFRPGKATSFPSRFAPPFSRPATSYRGTPSSQSRFVSEPDFACPYTASRRQLSRGQYHSLNDAVGRCSDCEPERYGR